MSTKLYVWVREQVFLEVAYPEAGESESEETHLLLYFTPKSF